MNKTVSVSKFLDLKSLIIVVPVPCVVAKEQTIIRTKLAQGGEVFGRGGGGKGPEWSRVRSEPWTFRIWG